MRFMALCSQYENTIKGQFYGHIHTDQWTLSRECTNLTNSSAYIETTGIKWCSGGGDYAPGDSFGAGVDGICPIVPPSWTDEKGVAACEHVCNNATECVGFTLYPNDTGHRICCFRTETTSYKPPCPTCSARCYEKPEPKCDGRATGVLLPGPSLTEGYPATNPALRELIFDASSYA